MVGWGTERLRRLEEAERREETKSDGTRAINYRNGSVKQSLPDARVVCVFVCVCVRARALVSAKGLNAIKQLG